MKAIIRARDGDRLATMGARTMTHNGRKIIATNGTSTAPVRLFHWWPGREFKRGWCPIPSDVVKGWNKKHRRYATYVEIRGRGYQHVPPKTKDVFAAYAECGPSDTPTRKIGREIALGRLAKQLESFGWRLETA